MEARHDFHAEDDAEAAMLASVLAEAIYRHQRYELRDHARCLVSMRDKIAASHQHYNLARLDALRQRNVLELEETFQQSHGRIARSQKLLDTIGDLRARCAAKPN